MELMFKVASVAIVALVFASVLRKNATEHSIFLSLATIILIFFAIAQGMEEILQGMYRLANIASLETSLLLPVVKTVGISILTKMTGELCRSGGEGGIATMVELSGTVLALLVALPLIEGVMTMMVEML